jgi:hypothetical protein
MPSLKNHPVSKRTKLLLVGDSGAGKTASLASLANAGYNLRIWDYDGGLDVLPSFLKKDATDVSYVTLRDSMKDASAFRKGVSLFSKYDDGDNNYGSVADWGENDVVVIDSLTFMGIASMNEVLKAAGKKPSAQPSQPEWGDAMRQLEFVVRYLTSEDVQCNVVVTSHIAYVEDDAGVSRMYPSALGRKLPTLIGRYFNTVVRMDYKPGKDGGSRMLRTVADHKMGLKNPAPDYISSEVEPDLAKLFEAIKKNAAEKTGG